MKDTDHLRESMFAMADEIDRLRAEYDDALRTITDMQSKFEAVSAENSWQDIASAPKTGEWVLAARKHCLLPGIVKWDQNYGCFENQAGDHIYNLTHWRPLPRTPGNEGKK